MTKPRLVILAVLLCVLLAPAVAQESGADNPWQATDEVRETASPSAPAVATAPVDDAHSAIVQTLLDVWRSFLGRIPFLVAGVLVLILTWVTIKLADRVFARVLERLSMTRSLRKLMHRMMHVVAWAFGLIIAAMVVFPGMTPTRALTGLGLGSVAIGFAFKDIFENFFAGILILWRFPFDPGDWIVCQEIEGKVVDVTIRNTLVRRVSGELVVIPNATIFKNPVDVLTNRTVRRITVIAGVAYGEDVDNARAVIRDAVEACDTVNHEQPVEIFAREFADSSIDFEVTWWSEPTPLDVRASRDEVVAAVKRALDEAGIEIPFPYRTLTFKEPLHMVEDGRHGGKDAEPKAAAGEREREQQARKRARGEDREPAAAGLDDTSKAEREAEAEAAEDD